MRLVVEEILDAEGKKVVRVEIASIDIFPVAIGDDLWLPPEAGDQRRRTVCVDSRTLVSESGDVLGILDIVDAADPDLVKAIWRKRQDGRAPPPHRRFNIEDVPTISREDARQDASSREVSAKAPPISARSSSNPSTPRVRFISPSGALEKCPACGETYKHVENPAKPGEILMSLCKCNRGKASAP
jgi:hypothetical protein